MPIYDFTQDQMTIVLGDPNFQEALRLVVATRFNTKPDWYAGDPRLLTFLDLEQPLTWWDILKPLLPKTGLSYLLPVQSDNTGIITEQDRDALMQLAIDGDLLARWSWPDDSLVQAVILTGTICRILFPKQDLYLHLRSGYATLSTSNGVLTNNSLIYDPLLLLGDDLPPRKRNDLILPFNQAMSWLIDELNICNYPDLEKRLSDLGSWMRMRNYHS